MAKTIGQVAYEKWVELVPHNPWVDWEIFSESAQQGWEEIAQAVVDENMRQKAIATAESIERVDKALAARGYPRGESDG